LRAGLSAVWRVYRVLSERSFCGILVLFITQIGAVFCAAFFCGLFRTVCYNGVGPAVNYGCVEVALTNWRVILAIFRVSPVPDLGILELRIETAGGPCE